MEDAKLPRPGIRLFYRYFRDLARNGYLESTSGRVGSKGALYVMTTKGIELYFSMQGAQTSEKAGLPVKNVSWNVTMRHCQNERIGSKFREQLHDMLVHFEYERNFKGPRLKFAVVKEEEDFLSNLRDPSVEFTWRVPDLPFAKDVRSLFHIKRVEVTTFKRVALGESVDEVVKLRKVAEYVEPHKGYFEYTSRQLHRRASDIVKIGYDFETVMPKTGSKFVVRVPYRARGFRIVFDVRQTAIDSVSVVDYFGLHEVKLGTLDSKRCRELMVDPSNEILPGSGVTFTWTKPPKYK